MSLATRIGEEFNLVRDEGMARLNALAPYNGIIGTDTKQQQENLVFSATVGNEYKLADTSRFRKIDGKVIDTYGPELITNGDFSNGATGWSIDAGWSIENNRAKATGAGGNISQWLPAVVGTKLVITVYVDNLTSATNNCDVKYNNVTILAIGSSTPIGKYTVYVNAVANGQFRVFSYTGVPGVTLDNISVREVQTIDFSRSGRHPFEVYTNIALVAPNNVLAGDYVVVDNPELVTNGTFDTDVSGWNYGGDAAAITISWDNGKLKTVVSGAYSYGWAYQSISTVIGKKYIITYDVDITSKSPIAYAQNSSGVEIARRTTKLEKNNSLEFIATTATTRIAFGNGAINATGIYDNISVKLADDTYRAIQDAPSGTALTNTTYFETRNYISNQVLAMQKADGTIHTETLFVDAYAVETTNAVLIKNGWSKVENGLYSKGTVVGTPVGYWQTLNSGGFHPVLNPMGACALGNTTFSTAGRSKWYESTVLPSSSTYDTIVNKSQDSQGRDDGKIGGVADSIYPRPDSKFYNIVYTDQFIDLRTNAEKANIPQLLNEVHNGAVNGSLGGYSDTVGTEQVTQTTTGTVTTLEVGTKLKYSVGDVLQIWNGATPYRRFVVSVSGTTVTLDSTIVKTAVPFIISGGKIPITMFKNRLKSKLYGSPLYYTQSIKDKLASGNLVQLDTTLVAESGTSLIPSRQSTFELSGSKAITMLSSVKSIDSDTAPTAPTWASTVPVLDSINNKFTQTLGTGDIAIINVASSNAVANISTPKAVQQVGNYVVATNSHSVYKGNNLTQLIGKVAVGDSLKSKVLEDLFQEYRFRSSKVVTTSPNNLNKLYADCTYFDIPNGLLNESYGDDYNTSNTYYGTVIGISGAVYEIRNLLYVSASRYVIRLREEYGNVLYDINNTCIVNIGTPSTVVTHSTITLDTSNSPAIKTLSTIAQADDGELLYQVFGEEIVGTGDTGSFSQLANGTKADWNGTTVRTVCAIIGTGVYE